ncbi:response regulator [bacterium]|nr:response regulator [bacterium]
MSETTASHRILVVEDAITNAEMLQDFLQEEGYLVELAADGLEAMQKVAVFQPDLILLDVIMPEMDGYEVCRLLKADPKSTHIPIVFLTGLADTRNRVTGLQLGAEDFIFKPFDLTEVHTRVRNLLLIKQYQDDLRHSNETLERRVMERTQELEQAVSDLLESQKRIELTYYDSIYRLSVAAEFRDNETSNHIRRMSRYSELLAAKCGLEDHDVKLIRHASPMHDVGKLGIPDAILRKPTRLTQEEFNVMKRHSEIGARILANSDSELIELAHTIAISHHEKWDGTGYPYGLTGEKTPLSGRIVAVADVFDALLSKRVYKRSFTIKETVQILRDSAGRHLDPQLVDYFLNSLDEVIEIAESFTDEVQETSNLLKFA